MTEAPKKPSTRVTTPEAILSYPHLFEPSAGPDGGEAKYSATFVFPKGTDLTALKAAALAAGVAKFGEGKFQEGVRSGKLYWPFRDDVEDKGYPAGSIFLGARNKQAPGLVSRKKNAANADRPMPITAESQKPGNEDELYAGCKVRASLSAFAFDSHGKKGVSFALGNVQKLGEGERLDSRRAAEDEFEADLSETPASIDDLL
jgi:hypothetical protein